MAFNRTNKSVMASWMETQEHRLHRERLWSAKSSVDTSAPYKPSFMRKNLK